MSEWTFDTLREYIDLAFANIDQRFQAQDKAVNVGMTAQRTAIDAALASQKEAVIKAEIATEHRFSSVNEFREQSAQQQATYVTIAEFQAELRALRASNEAVIIGLRSTYEASTLAMQTSIGDLKDRLTRSEGRGAGLKDGWGYIVAAIGVAVALSRFF